MRVLHIIRGLLNSSGTTHIVGPLSEAQARLGAQVDVAFVEKAGGQAVLPEPKLVTSHRFPATLDLGNPGISLPFRSFMNEQVSCYDVVHIHAIWNFPTYWAMRSADRLSVPYIVAPQGSLDNWALQARRKGRRLYETIVEKPLFQRARYIQALSKSEAEQIRAFGIEAPIVEIPNGVDPNMFSGTSAPLASQIGLASGQKTLLFLSRLHPKKGADILLKAFAQSKNLRDGWTLVVAGNDAGSGYADKLKELARQLQLQDRCRFIGEVRGKNKVATLCGADAFVLPTHSEGLPVALLEALAAGLPVITSPGANLPELTSVGAGIVVPNTPEAVCAAMEDVAENPEAATAMANRGRNLVMTHFAWSAIAQQTLEIYHEMTNPPSTLAA